MILLDAGRFLSWRWFPKAGDKFVMAYLSGSHTEVILSHRGDLAMSFLVVITERVLLASGG